VTIMRVALINPPMPERTYPGKAMGLDYLATPLLEDNFTVEIFDLDVLGKISIENILKVFRPQVVGITNLSLQNDLANQLARSVKQFDKSIIVVKGGFHELFGFGTTLEYHHDYVDYVVVGEGEKTFLEFIRSAARGTLLQDREDIPGLAYYDGSIKYTGKRQSMVGPDLDIYTPSRLCHYTTYDYDVFGKRKTAQILTVRGCKDACNFCTESRFSRIERSRSLDSIYGELQELSGEGYEAIYFDDSTFTRNQTRTIDICNMMKTYFPQLVWGCNTRVDCLTPDLISLMYQSGCVYMFTGLESAVPDVLVGLNKTQNPKVYLSKAEEVYRTLHENKLTSSVFLIFGAPRKIVSSGKVIYELESFDDIKTSLDFVFNRLKPYYLSMNVLRLLPGVPFSIGEKFRILWPGEKVIHAGYYDNAWYSHMKMTDLRTKHDVYLAFEARSSIVPPNMTPHYCYRILEYAVQQINKSNGENGHRCKLVVDKEFEDKYLTCHHGKYDLAPFESMN
jgi:anaerobic magnesium-protoporphyrin IX monomethyl ester cyclase